MALKKCLNLGCGNDIKRSISNVQWINLDVKKHKGVDLVWNLNKFPWPFKDNTFDFVYCKKIMEYPQRLDLAMLELERITKNGGIIEIISPYAKSDGALKHHNFITQDTSLTYMYHSVLLSVEYSCTGALRKLIPLKKVLSIFLWNIYDVIYLKIQIKK